MLVELVLLVVSCVGCLGCVARASLVGCVGCVVLIVLVVLVVLVVVGASLSALHGYFQDKPCSSELPHCCSEWMKLTNFRLLLCAGHCKISWRIKRGSGPSRRDATNGSVMIDGYRPHAVYNYVRDWCEAYHLPTNKTIAATGKKKYTAVEAETLAVAWCNRMAYLYEIWRTFSDDSFEFEYSMRDVEQYQEPPALAALMVNVPTSPSAIRFVQSELRTLVPRLT